MLYIEQQSDTLQNMTFRAVPAAQQPFSGLAGWALLRAELVACMLQVGLGACVLVVQCAFQIDNRRTRVEK